MLTLERPRAHHHALSIERVREMVRIRPLERATDFTPHDTVFVGLSLSVETWMELRINLLRREHPDGVRQQAIDRAAQIVERNRVLDAERRHLSERVNPCIGAPRPGHVHRAPLHPRNDVLERPLDRRQSRLPLPAMKRRAVVRDLDLDAAHYAGREPGFTTGMPAWHSGHVSGW